MLSRKFNFIILLVCVLFITAIKSNSNLVNSPNEDPPPLSLIVDSNKINSYSSECGISLENSCNNIVDAMKYFHEYISKPENINSKLLLLLVDGTYLGKENYLNSGLGIDIFLSTYDLSTGNAVIDGTGISVNLFNYDINGVIPLPTTKTKLHVSNIAFKKFDNPDYKILSSNTGYKNKMKTDFIFVKCLFSNSKNIIFSAYGESKELNILYFLISTFSNVSFPENPFSSTNYSTVFSNSFFDSVSFEGSFIGYEEGTEHRISRTNFKNVSYGTKIQNSSFINSGQMFLRLSSFSQLSGPKTSSPSHLFRFFSKTDLFIVDSNIFENFDGGLIEFNNVSGSLESNIISNTGSNSTIFKTLNSNVSFENNRFNYTNNLNGAQLIECTGSSLSFSNNAITDNFKTNPNCKDCELVIDYKNICQIEVNSATTTTVSYQLLLIILIVISLLNI
ncbi:hypothetical protein ACTFIW_007548 [Dictyostelium discoideum]